jgi:hypothetical protein
MICIRWSLESARSDLDEDAAMALVREELRAARAERNAA